MDTLKISFGGIQKTCYWYQGLSRPGVSSDSVTNLQGLLDQAASTLAPLLLCAGYFLFLQGQTVVCTFSSITGLHPVNRSITHTHDNCIRYFLHHCEYNTWQEYVRERRFLWFHGRATLAVGMRGRLFTSQCTRKHGHREYGGREDTSHSILDQEVLKREFWPPASFLFSFFPPHLLANGIVFPTFRVGLSPPVLPPCKSP